MKRYEFVIGGDEFEVVVESVGLEEATVVVNGERYDVGIKAGLDAPPVAAAAAQPQMQVVAAAPVAAKPAAPAAGGGGGEITAPLPGLILTVPVNVGDTVSPGDVVIRMEAMKMENDVKASTAGVVQEVRTKPGDEVLVGQVLLVIG